MQLYFIKTTGEDGIERLDFQFGDADADMAVDGRFSLLPDERFRNLDYATLAAAAPGIVTLDADGIAHLQPEDG